MKEESNGLSNRILTLSLGVVCAQRIFRLRIVLW